jgi:uncharacterized iron-regulated protein
MKPLLHGAFASVVIGAASLSGAADRVPPPSEACLTPAAWSVADGARYRAASASAVFASAAKRDVVLLGESHGDDDHHRWQLQALTALYALRPNMVIGFEMFPRRLQPVLERWVAGQLTLRQFLDQSEWDTVWNLPFDLYLPLFQFARINRIPMVALNVDNKLNKSITAKGWDAVPPAEREGVGRAAPPSAAYRAFLLEVYGEHSAMRVHAKGDPQKSAVRQEKSVKVKADKDKGDQDKGDKDGADKDGADKNKADKEGDDGFRYFVESQTTWDRAMAEVLARHTAPRAAGAKPLVVGIIGSGHLRFGHGVPHQLRDLGVTNVATLLPLAADSDCKELRIGLADAVFALPPQASAKPEPPRLGVQLEQNEAGVQIAAITAGSLAERSGLKSGDRLIELGGMPVSRISPAIATIRQQPPGSWLPLRLQRGGATLDLVVKFPPKP